MPEPVKISIIIPVFNEGENLNRLLGILEKLEYNSTNFEVIIADSGDDHLSLSELRPNFHVLLTQKGRALQMNEGANLASGQVLFFLHGDCIISKDALKKIESSISKGAKWGCFRVAFMSDKKLMKVCGLLSNLRVRLRKIAFGDQGIFIRRELFSQIGGFKPIPIMEDYKLSIDLKSLGIYPAQLNSKIISSARRFEADGFWRTVWNMQKCQFCYRHGVSIEKIAEYYGL